MKRRNILVIIALLAAGGYLVSLQFPKREYLAQGRGEQKNNAELELKIQQLNDLLQAIIQANLAHHRVEQEKPQPDRIQKLQEVTAQKEALEQELIQAKAGLELGRAKQRFSKEEQSLSRQLKEKENAALALKNRLGEEKAKYDGLSKNFNIASEELKRVKNTKTALERAVTEAERIKDELGQTNTSLKAEISRIRGELKDTQAKFSLSFQEKQSAIKQKDEASRQNEQLRQASEEFKQANQRAEKELSSLKNSIEQLDKEKRALKDELKETKKLNLNTQKLQEELIQLQAQLELLNKTYTDLQNEHTAIQRALKQNEIDLGARADRILVSEEKLKMAETQLADTQLKYRDMEKESALAKEQNVALQLEREDLKNQVQQAKLRLNELENQASQILKLLIPAETAGVTLPKEESKGVDGSTALSIDPEHSRRVELELFPAGPPQGADQTTVVWTPMAKATRDTNETKESLPGETPAQTVTQEKSALRAED